MEKVPGSQPASWPPQGSNSNCGRSCLQEEVYRAMVSMRYLYQSLTPQHCQEAIYKQVLDLLHMESDPLQARLAIIMVWCLDECDKMLCGKAAQSRHRHKKKFLGGRTQNSMTGHEMSGWLQAVKQTLQKKLSNFTKLAQCQSSFVFPLCVASIV